MSDTIQITTFGGFSISYRDRGISDCDNRSKKLWALLEYLIAFHKEEVPHSKLISVLWHDERINVDPENALKTILHRTRTILDQLGYKDGKLILHHRDNYCWNDRAETRMDFEEFQDYCDKVDSPSFTTDEKLGFCRKAYALYKGDFLERNFSDDWIKPIASYYHSLYLKMVHCMIEILLAKERYDEIIGICSNASKIDIYDEMLNYNLIRCLYLTGKQEMALSQYDKVLHLYYDQFGIDPSDNIKKLYQEIVKEKCSPVNDLSTIKAMLEETNAKKQAYCCDVSVFKNLYRIEARSAARTGQSVFLCLLTMHITRQGANNEYMAMAMERMSDTIAHMLRAGDVYSRFAVNQYIIMLPAASYENCTEIAKRMIRGFETSKPKLAASVQYNLNELDPASFTD